MSDVSQKPPVHFTSSEGYFDLTPALRDASLLSTGSGASGHHDSATDRTGDSQKPRTMPATDSALSTSSQLAGSKPVAAFIDAFGQQKSVDSLQPDTDLRPPQRDQRAQSAPPATFSESAQSTEAVSALGGGGGASYTSEPAFGPKPAGEGDLISNREGKQTDLGGLMLAASSAQSTPPNRRSASDVIMPPDVGARFSSREEFKNACQNHALSLSASDPAKRFHFSTRTSALGKWLVFSCHKHAKGCPVAVKVEVDKNTQEWVVTSACYQHSHFASNDIVPTLNPQTEVTPSKRAQNKRFSIIRKKSEAPSTSFIREGSAPLTEGDLTDSSVSSARRKYKKRRTFSDTSVMLSQSSQAARVRHLVPDGAARAAFLQQQKRNLYRLSTPPAQEGLDPVAASPRIKSDRERGLSLQHNLSHSRSGSDAGDPSGSLPSSPTESISSSSQFIGKKRTYSSISNDRSFSHTATPFMDTLIANPIQAPAGWGSAPRRSPSPAPVDASMTLHQYLTSLHPLLGDLDPAFRSAGIFDVSTVLSLEKSELEAVIDGFSSEHSTLQRMLAKNRIGRSLS